mmetsp:Transcript_52979/g.139629  ORF Transcript_52979/g.139629 Transcript_52979/m.139629 type:complete len:200 (-) Transcript_52979:379-978(-)
MKLKPLLSSGSCISTAPLDSEPSKRLRPSSPRRDETRPGECTVLRPTWSPPRRPMERIPAEGPGRGSLAGWAGKVVFRAGPRAGRTRAAGRRRSAASSAPRAWSWRSTMPARLLLRPAMGRPAIGTRRSQRPYRSIAMGKPPRCWARASTRKLLSSEKDWDTTPNLGVGPGWGRPRRRGRRRRRGVATEGGHLCQQSTS